MNGLQAYYRESVSGYPMGKRSAQLHRTCFQGDARVYEKARVFTESELNTLRVGTAQRGEAIRRFLVDHFSGERKYLEGDVIPADSVERIFRRGFPLVAEGCTTLRKLEFWYGPDVIRDHRGRFRVIEDNVGFVGGFGDLNACASALKELRGGVPAAKPIDPFYQRLVEHYRREARRFGNGLVLLLSYPKKVRVTHEDERLANALKALGVRATTSTARLRIRGKRLYFGKERVSFLISNVDAADLEPSIVRGGEQYFSPEMKGFWNAFSSGGFGLSTHPASEYANDKELYIHVEKMVRFYLKESCVLRNLEARSLAKPRTLDSVFSELDRWVVKASNGKGGDEVWIGRKLRRAEIRALYNRVRINPGHYIAQSFTELSRIEHYSLDARPLAVIAPGGSLVCELPWGRGVSHRGEGKVNISRGGVLVISDRKEKWTDGKITELVKK